MIGSGAAGAEIAGNRSIEGKVVATTILGLSFGVARSAFAAWMSSKGAPLGMAICTGRSPINGPFMMCAPLFASTLTTEKETAG